MLGEVRDWIEELACRAGLDGLPALGGAMKWGGAIALAAALAWLAWGMPSQGGAGAATPGGTAAAPSSEASAATPAAPATVTVHVVGEVRNPGVFELPAGARARDVVAAAGGLLGDAEQGAVNLARVVTDGEQIVVPRQGEVAVGVAASGPAGSGPGAKLDLNTATAEQLDTLPGVGPATAAKIISDRTANGPFRNVDDLMRVSGIGPAKFDSLKDLVRTN